MDLAAEAGIAYGCVVAVNDVGGILPYRITHWATLHPEKLGPWRARRIEEGGNQDFLVVSNRKKAGVDCVLRDWGGSSGLLGVQAALHLGRCNKIVLAGVPMSKGPHYHKDAAWMHAQFYRVAWKTRLRSIEGIVRSMSGWTQELLGAPSSGWLRSGSALNNTEMANGQA
jgi:hypothetical protein